MGDGRNREDELYLNHREGYRLPVSVRVAPLKNERGEITGAIELFNDIGSREALRLKIVELEKLALLDSLTGLPNRRHLESEIIGNLAKLSRTGESFGLLFFDIDRFKRFNDTCGHRLGDEVLRVLAKTLLSCVRPYDLIGRWGGEEFVGVFPGIDTEGLRRTAERLRTLAAMSRVATGNGSVSVTVSIGGAVASCGDSLDSLLRKVDGLMYHSKNLGGNRSTLEQQGHGTERLAAIDADGGPV
jgi:diguanylate cyclase (GGDEF)-like protein